MKCPRSIGLAGLAVLMGCSSSPATDQKPNRANDPLSELSASEVYTQMGVRYMESGQYEIALKDLEKAIELDDDNSEAFNAFGVLQQKLDSPAKAEAAFRRSISLKADNYGARNNYGRFLCTQGRYTEAFQQFQMVISTKLYGQPWIPLTNAGVCAKTAGRLPEAELYLRQALDADPGFPPALLEMARVSRARGDNATARTFVQRYNVVTGGTRESMQLGLDVETALGNRSAANEYAKRLREQRYPLPPPGGGN